MRAVRSAPPGVTVVDVEEPTGPGEVVAIRSAGICASDFMYIGYGFTMLLGHELAGVTEDGTPVAIEGIFGCGGGRTPPAWVGAAPRSGSPPTAG